MDPGTQNTGYGVVELQGNRLTACDYGTLRTRPAAPLQQRLVSIADGLARVLEDPLIESAGVESLFAAHNVASALKLGHARGVVLLGLARRGLVASDYSPSEVKQAVVGNGRAGKDQVAEMVRFLLRLPALPPPDAADALAVAICHLMHQAPAARRSP